MAGPFPCPNPPTTCETNPNPSTGFSSEAQDSTTFIGLAWNGTPPALNKPFNVVPCEAIAESQVSQADADRIAQNAAVVCASACTTPFTNTAQTATGTCPNGSVYALTIPAGLYTAENQVLANRKAFTAAVAALRGHSVCLGSLAPASVCKGDFYFGVISLVATDLPATIQLIAGDVPNGLTLSLESDRAVLQGTALSFGASRFTLQATNSVGVVTQQEYLVTVTGIVTGSVLTPGTDGTDYSAQLTATIPDGSTPVWLVISGALPDGLTLDQSTGAITGTPTTAGDSAFTVSVTAAGNTCSKQFSIHIASGVVPPHCLTNTGIAFTTLAGGSPDGPFAATYSASIQRAALVFPSDGKIVFINTATNAVVNTITMATGYTPGFRYHSVAFATSTQNFFFTNDTFSAMNVTDIDGNVVGTLTPPGGTNFARTPWAYSPDTDRLYTLQFFGGTGTDHILEYNPHTLALTRDIDTGTVISGSGGVMCYPGNLVAWSNGGLFNFPLSTLINDKTSPFFQTRGYIAYDPVSNRLFAGQSFSNDIQTFNVSDFSFSTDFSGANVGPYGFVVYNPITKSVIGMTAFAEMVVIDPSNDTIICEFTPDPNAFNLLVDYNTGDVYFYLYDGANNPINVWD